MNFIAVVNFEGCENENSTSTAALLSTVKTWILLPVYCNTVNKTTTWLYYDSKLQSPSICERSRNSFFPHSLLRSLSPPPGVRLRACACVQWLPVSAAAASLFKLIHSSLSASSSGLRELEPNTKTAGIVYFTRVVFFKKLSLTDNQGLHSPPPCLQRCGGAAQMR